MYENIYFLTIVGIQKETGLKQWHQEQCEISEVKNPTLLLQLGDMYAAKRSNWTPFNYWLLQ